MSKVNDLPSTSTTKNEMGTFINRGGGLVLLLDGHQYYKKKTFKTGVTVYECNQRRKKCRGSLNILDNAIIKVNTHSHAPDFAKNVLDEKLHIVKQEVIASEANRSVPIIYKEAVASLKDKGLDLIKNIQPFRNVKTSLYTARNKAVKMKKIVFTGADVEKVVIPPKFDSFLLADYSHAGCRITIFCAEDMRDLLRQQTEYLSDGTFKSCPEPYHQLYSIHADFGTKNLTTDIVPVVYALMSHKDQNSYELLFNLIKSQIPEWKPKTYKTDFEPAAMAAIQKIFPDVIIKGCYFHFNKAVWKKGSKLGLTKSKILKRQVALSAVLPLVPCDEILNGWSYIAAESPDDDQSKKFRSYMLKQWIKVNDNDFRQKWCVFDERHRTTNFLEGWHNGVNKAVGKKTPNIYMLLTILKKDAGFYRVISQQIQSGTPPASNPRMKYNIMKDEFVQFCQTQFLAGDITLGHLLEKLK